MEPEIKNKLKGGLFGDKKRLLIIIIAGLVVIGLTIGCFYYLNKNNKDNNNNNNTKENNKDTNKDTNKENNNSEDNTPEGSGISFAIFKSAYSDLYYTAAQIYNEGDTKVGEYHCQNQYCTYYSVMKNNILVHDGDYYYVYNYVKDELIKVSLGTESYLTLSLVGYDGKAYGIVVPKGEKRAFYSIEDKKYTTDFIYDTVYSDDGEALKRGYIFAGNYGEDYTNGEYYILNMKTGEVIFTTDSNINTISNNGHLYYLNEGPAAGLYNGAKIYNSDLKLLFNGETYTEHEVTKDGNIVVANYQDTNFKEYNSSGQLLSTSKTYKSVELIIENYVGVVDTDDYIKLVDYNDNIIASFVKLTDNLYFHSAISGYYKNGIYFVVEDKSTEEGIMGHCKEYYYEPSTKKTGVEEVEACSGYAKPVLYLYPKKETEVNVTFEKPHLLTTTYPKYNNSWNVTAYPNGDLYDSNKNYYYALYWEELGSNNIDFKTGFYVTKDNAIKFLEEKLSIIGLNKKERNEFIMYWLPILEKNGKNLVYFELTDQRQMYNKLMIKPTPESLLRVAMHVKKVDSYVNIKEEKLTTFNRTGFSAIEWGGVEH